jgi:hypothetical protein
MDKHEFDIIPFKAFDGFECNLWRLKHNRPKHRGPVMLVHGAGVRANIFNPPNEVNLLDMLAEAGYDVFLENWRASTEFPANKWDLDVVAKNDHPAAIQKVCEVSGSASCKAIIHCQGSTSFMISAVEGLVPQVKTIVTNAVSLHPVVPSWSRVKLDVVLEIAGLMTDYLNPRWGDDAPDFRSKFFRALVLATHFEKDTNVGKFVSFTYGAGFPALWELENLSDETMDWIRNEFGPVPVHFFRHIRKGVHNGSLVSVDGAKHYAEKIPATDARFVFFAGKLNKCFRSESQVNSFDYFNRLKPGFHKLYVYDTYSHLDIFLGKNAHKDIFPVMIDELNT